MPTKKYTREWRDKEFAADAKRYGTLAHCVDLLGDQLDHLDQRLDRQDPDRETRFLDEYWPVIQEAFLVIMVAQMEHHLKKVCDILAELRNFNVRSTDMKGANGF